MNRSTLRGGNIRLNAAIWLLFAALGLAGAAVAQTYTKQNARVMRMQFDTTYDANFAATHVNATSYLATSYVNTTNAADTHDKPAWDSVSFDLLDPNLAGTTITAAGKTVTYPQLAALLRQASLDRANAAGIQ